MKKRVFTNGRYKIIPFLLLILLFSTVSAAKAATVSEYPIDGYEYEAKEDGTLRLTNLKSEMIPSDDYIMRIPETIDGKTVTELGRFGNHRCGGTNLVEVILPKTVTRIGGDQANSPFQDCEKLKKVTLYDTFEVFGYQAFMNCESLEEIEVRSSTTDEVIAHWPESFQKMPKLREIDKGAFDDCVNLSCSVLVLPESVEVLGSQPFDGVTLSTLYLMNPDPSGYTENFLFPNTRTDFVAICPGKEVYQGYYDHIHAEEYGNMYTQFLTYELDVTYDQNESKSGGVKHSLWNQALRYTEECPSDPYSIWKKDPGYTMLDPGQIPEVGHQYLWYWDREGGQGPVTPDHRVQSDRLYGLEKPVDPVVTVENIDEVYTGESFPLKIHATSPLVRADLDLKNPEDGDCRFYYAVVDWGSSPPIVYQGTNPNGFTVKNVKDSRTTPTAPGYLVFVQIQQYDSTADIWETVYEPDYIRYGYENASAEVRIRPAAPVIAPVAQSPVPVGTKLTDIPLSSQAGDTPGILSWSAPDTAVTEGEESYAWTFTPTDIENYEYPVTGTLPITGLADNQFWIVALHNEENVRKLSVQRGNSLTLPAPEAKEGHFFENWNTKADGTGTAYENLATLTPESNLDLYARWAEGCTVTYEIGEDAVWDTLPPWIQRMADGKYQQFVKKGANLHRPSPAPKREGYGLTGWKYEKCFGSSCFKQEFYFDDNPWMKERVTTDLTLMAQWAPNHTVTFDPNGGTGTMEAVSAPEGQYILPRSTDFTRPGYIFDGWALTAEGEKIDNTYIFLSGDATLYAHWIPGTDTAYTVEHYLQKIDGTWEAEPHEQESLTGITGQLTQAAAKEYPGFTAQSIDQKAIAGDGTTVVKILYLRNTYTVRFDPNGGEGFMESVTVPWGPYSLSESSGFTKAGYIFDGWALTAEGEKVVGTVIDITGDTTLYAHWIPGTDTAYTVEHYLQKIDGTWEAEPYEQESLTGITGQLTQAAAKEYPGFTAQSIDQKAIAGDGTTVVKILYLRNTYTVRFDPNGGEGITEVQKFSYDEEKPLTENGFLRSNYQFSGWNTKKDGNGTAYENAQMVKNLTAEDNGIVTLYAMWTDQDSDPSPHRPPILQTEDHFSYLQGYPDNSFGPNNNMTRGEVAQMFYNLLLNKDIPSVVAFEDVPENAWYADAVNTLAALGIVKGVDAAHYEPNRTITRAEFTVIAMRFTASKTVAPNIFSDVAEGAWYYDQVLGAVQEGWIRGYEDGTFRPNQTITRAEVTAITNRMLNRSADVQYVDAHGDMLKDFPDVKSDSWYYYDVMEATNAHEYVKDQDTERWTKA